MMISVSLPGGLGMIHMFSSPSFFIFYFIHFIFFQTFELLWKKSARLSTRLVTFVICVTLSSHFNLWTPFPAASSLRPTRKPKPKPKRKQKPKILRKIWCECKHTVTSRTHQWSTLLVSIALLLKRPKASEECRRVPWRLPTWMVGSL